MKKVGHILLTVFSVGVIVTLFAGGLAFVGYLIALVIGGSAAETLCGFLFKTYLPWVIRFTSVFAGCGLIGMYFTKQKALTAKSENVKNVK